MNSALKIMWFLRPLELALQNEQLRTRPQIRKTVNGEILVRCRELLLPQQVESEATSGERWQAVILKPFVSLKTGGLQQDALESHLSDFVSLSQQFLWLHSRFCGKLGQTKDIIAILIKECKMVAQLHLLQHHLKTNRSHLFLSFGYSTYDVWCHQGCISFAA